KAIPDEWHDKIFSWLPPGRLSKLEIANQEVTFSVFHGQDRLKAYRDMLPRTAELQRRVDEEIARTAYEPRAGLGVFSEFADSSHRAIHRCALPPNLVSRVDSLTLDEAVNLMESVKVKLHVILGAIAMEEIRIHHLRRLLRGSTNGMASPSVLEKLPSADVAASTSVNKSRNAPSETTIWRMGGLLAVTTSAIWLFMRTPGLFWKGRGAS
ncbi:MAG: hypothetical protein Q9183_004497, partial [Haloplaca sp. 2 TL-2023]